MELPSEVMHSNQTDVSVASLTGVKLFDASWQICALVFFIVFGTVENMLFTSTIVCTPRLFRPVYVIICKLALLDLTHAAIIQPLALASILFSRWPFEAHMCNLFAWLGVALSVDYVSGLLTFLVDRVFAVVFPLLYFDRTQTRSGKKKSMCTALAVNVFLTLISLALAAAIFAPSYVIVFDQVRLVCLPSESPKADTKESVFRKLFFILSIIIHIGGWCLVIAKALWQEKCPCCRHRLFYANSSSSSLTTASISRISLRHRRQLWRHLHCFSAATILYIVCYIPFVSAMFHDARQVVVVTTTWLFYCRPCFMPILFVSIDNDLRRSLSKLLGKVSPFSFGQPLVISRSATDEKGILMREKTKAAIGVCERNEKKSYSAGSLELNILNHRERVSKRRQSAPGRFTV